MFFGKNNNVVNAEVCKEVIMLLIIIVILFFVKDFSFAQGELDDTFGKVGKVITNITPSYDDYGYSTLFQEDGKVIVAGYAYNGPSSNANFNVVRYNIDGTLDETFGIGGRVTTDFNNSHDYVSTGGAAIQSNGKIVVAGYSYSGSNSDFAVARYNVDGTLDSSFGISGKITTDFGSNSDYGYSIAIQNNGKIVVAGYASD